jgi:hypothetical protein
MPSYHFLKMLLWTLFALNSLCFLLLPLMLAVYGRILARRRQNPACIEQVREWFRLPLAWAMCSCGLGLVLAVSVAMCTFPAPATMPGILILALAQGLALYALLCRPAKALPVTGQPGGDTP